MSPIGGRPYGQYLPASYGQLRSLKIEGDTARQNLVYTAFEIAGELEVQKLKTAISQLVTRHGILRTSFRIQGDEWYQYIEDNVNVNIEIYSGECDLTSVSSTRVLIEKAPLLRIQLFRKSEKESLLLIIMHHLITDGLSQSLFKKELSEYYNGKTPPFPNGALLHYADFTLWQQESTCNHQLEFWKLYLHQMPLKEYLKADLPSTLKREYLVDSYLFTLSETELTSLRFLSMQLEVSLFIFLLAIFQILLFLHSGEEDVVVGSPVSNRHRAGSEGILGPLVNIVFLRNRCNKEMSVVDFVESVKLSTLSVYDNQDYPFHKLAMELPQFANEEYLSLFQIMFGYGGDKASLVLEGLLCRELNVKTTHFHYDLTTVIYESDTDLKISMLYSKDKFKPSTIENFANQYKELLCLVVRTPHQLIGSLVNARGQTRTIMEQQ